VRWTARGLRLVDRLRGRPAIPELNRSLIARYAPGRSFADVGCMWKVNGAYAFHALARGASPVIGVDVTPATPEFIAENAAAGDRVRFVHGDINDPATHAAIGRVDVVFCAGVLYHVPNPLFTLEQLRRICGETLILVSAAIPERAVPQAAVFLPYLDAAGRRALNYATPDAKVGLDTEFVPDWGYANWFWGFTPSCVVAMVRTTGFEVLEEHVYPQAVCVVCRPAGRRQAR
jgi:SAM-dependent methyltransferase